MKRRWFQLHLSTAMALTFASALLLWANLIPSEGMVDETISYTVPAVPVKNYTSYVHETWHHWGWPSTACSQRQWSTVATEWKWPDGIAPKRYSGPEPAEFIWPAVYRNGFVALIALIALAFGCEWYARLSTRNVEYARPHARFIPIRLCARLLRR